MTKEILDFHSSFADHTSLVVSHPIFDDHNLLVLLFCAILYLIQGKSCDFFFFINFLYTLCFVVDDQS